MGRLFAFLIAAGTAILPGASLSENGPAGIFDIRYAVVFETGEPIAGTASCSLGKMCSLIASAPVKIDILLSKEADGHHAFDELVIGCESSCSFAMGRSRIPLSGQSRFVFFDGADPSGVNGSLVYRRHEKLGEIFLIYPRADGRYGEHKLETL